MADWGGPRPGAGRKPKEAGKTRVSLSTRISDQSSQRLRAYAERSGKTLGQVLDELVAYVAEKPDFDALMTDLVRRNAPAATLEKAEAAAEAYEQLKQGLELATTELESRRVAAARQSKLGAALFEMLPGAVAVADEQLVIRFAKREWAEHFGRAVADVLDKPLEELLGTIPAVADMIVREAVASNQPHRIVVEPQPNAPATAQAFELVLSALLDSDGGLLGILAAI